MYFEGFEGFRLASDSRKPITPERLIWTDYLLLSLPLLGILEAVIFWLK